MRVEIDQQEVEDSALYVRAFCESLKQDKEGCDLARALDVVLNVVGVFMVMHFGDMEVSTVYEDAEEDEVNE